MNYRLLFRLLLPKTLKMPLKITFTMPVKKVALDFLKDYRKTYKALQTNPFYQFHDNNYRFSPFDKFPYIAFFILDEPSKTIFLNAVFHTSQDPEKYPSI